MSDRHKRDNLLVQFRAGAALGKRLRALADRRKVNTNELARRLVVLAVMGLTEAHYEAIEQLEDGAEDFSAACGQVLVALDVHERLTAKHGAAPLTTAQRLAFLREWAADFAHKQATRKDSPAVEAAEQPPEVYRRIRRDRDSDSDTKKKSP